MQYPYWMGALARSSGSLPPEVQDASHAALADAGACLWELSMNMDLSRAAWRRAWDVAHSRANYTKMQGVSVQMVGRPLAQTEVEHAVRTDTRASVLEELTRWNVLGEVALERAVSRAQLRKASSGASSLLIQPGFPEERVAEVASSLNLMGLLRVLAFGPPGRLDREWALARAASFPSNRSHLARRNRMVQFALLRDPELAELAARLVPKNREMAHFFAVPMVGSRAGVMALEAAGTVKELLEAAPLGSRGFVMMALASNPVASEELLKEIASGSVGGVGSRASTMAASRLSGAQNAVPPAVDLLTESSARVLSLCVDRSLPGGLYNASGRPERMILMARNPNLADTERERITTAFAEAVGYEREVWLTDEVGVVLPGWAAAYRWSAQVVPLDEPLRRMFEEFGADRAAWDSVVRLGVSWEGTMADLLATAKLV